MGPKKESDFIAEGATKRLDALDDFKREYEGLNFYNKVVEAIKESTAVQDQIKLVFTASLKEKIIWLLFGAVGLVIIGLLQDIGKSLIEKI
jgi:hypothetical protein